MPASHLEVRGMGVREIAVRLDSWVSRPSPTSAKSLHLAHPLLLRDEPALPGVVAIELVCAELVRSISPSPARYSLAIFFASSAPITLGRTTPNLVPIICASNASYAIAA